MLKLQVTAISPFPSGKKIKGYREINIEFNKEHNGWYSKIIFIQFIIYNYNK